MTAGWGPLTVTAELLSAPILDRPVYLDGLLLAGLGELLGSGRADGWEDPERICSFDLPLDRVTTPYGWWWAASGVIPHGCQQVGHLNRVPLVEEAGRWTRQKSINQASGPDKRLRRPYYYRPEMLSLTWTCVGHPSGIAELLARVPAVGQVRGHGHGWIGRWRVERGGPALEAYGRDIRLRHLPAEMPFDRSVGAVTRRQLPLRPPYHRRAQAVPCWQVQQ